MHFLGGWGWLGCALKGIFWVEMFWWVVSVLLLLFVAYATYVLFFGLDKEEGTSLSDFIKESEGDQYCNRYSAKGARHLAFLPLVGKSADVEFEKSGDF